MDQQDAAYHEAELLRLIRDGDEQAFERIYRKYATKLSVKLIQILKSEELAQDILQDVFTRLWEIREQINPDLSFSSFLYKIATNMSYNVYQRALREQIILKENHTAEEYTPLDLQINNKEVSELLEKALATLTPRQREVYTMHKIDGLSYKEISEQLQISSSAINHHIQEANIKLRLFLKPYYPMIVFMLMATGI